MWGVRHHFQLTVHILWVLGSHFSKELPTYIEESASVNLLITGYCCHSTTCDLAPLIYALLHRTAPPVETGSIDIGPIAGYLSTSKMALMTFPPGLPSFHYLPRDKM